jgi:hypothetical protein
MSPLVAFSTLTEFTEAQQRAALTYGLLPGEWLLKAGAFEVERYEVPELRKMFAMPDAQKNVALIAIVEGLAPRGSRSEGGWKLYSVARSPASQWKAFAWPMGVPFLNNLLALFYQPVPDLDSRPGGMGSVVPDVCGEAIERALTLVAELDRGLRAAALD